MSRSKICNDMVLIENELLRLEKVKLTGSVCINIDLNQGGIANVSIDIKRSLKKNGKTCVK